MLSIKLTPRKRFNLNELLTTARLNLAQWLTAVIEGALSTSQLEDRAVTTAKAEMGGAWFRGVDAGTATAHAVTIGTQLTNYADGMMVIYPVNTDCTGAAITITITGDGGAFSGSKPLKTVMGTNPRIGEVKAGYYLIARYASSSDSFQILSVNHTRDIIAGSFEGSTTANAWVVEAETVNLVGWDYLGEAVNRLLLLTAEYDNTTAVTLDYDGLGAKAVRTPEDTAIAPGQIVAGMQLLLTYNAAFNSGVGAWVVLSPLKQAAARINPSVRQTVLSGEVDSGGHPNFLGFSGQNVSIAANTTPLIIAFAAGFDASGPLDYAGRVSADIADAWTLPTIDATYYLYVERATNGDLSYGYVTTRPSYVHDDAAATTTDVHTFLINEMQMYVGGGVSATVKQRVFVGEAVVASNVISSVTSYMFRGRFQSKTDQTLGAPNADQNYTESHRLGMQPESVGWYLVCVSSDIGYAAGDRVPIEHLTHSTGIKYDMAIQADDVSQCTIRMPWGTRALSVRLCNKGSYALGAIDTANDWKLRCVANRGW